MNINKVYKLETSVGHIGRAIRIIGDEDTKAAVSALNGIVSALRNHIVDESTTNDELIDIIKQCVDDNIKRT
jgi:hypothetical protein